MSKPQLTETTFRDNLNADPDQWGQSHVTDAEWQAIFQARSEAGDWTRVQQMLLQGSIGPPTDVDEVDFMKSAIQHGCSRAYPIYESTERTIEDSIWSYTMKNRAFRFFVRHISDPEILAAWKGSEQKSCGEIGVIPLIRPEGIPDDVLFGIEKPDCYLPCQLLRVMEALRTGRENLLTSITREIIPLTDEERDLLQIHWIDFQDAISRSTSISDLAANVAFDLYRILHEKGMDQEKALSIIFQGYRPHGALLEHGQLDSLLKIWLLTAYKVDLCYDTHMWQKTRPVFQNAVDIYNEHAQRAGVPELRIDVSQ